MIIKAVSGTTITDHLEANFPNRLIGWIYKTSILIRNNPAVKCRCCQLWIVCLRLSPGSGRFSYDWTVPH